MSRTTTDADRPSRLVWTIPLLAAAALILCFVGFVHAFQIEPTAEAVREASKGGWIALPALIALATAFAALFVQRRRHALIVVMSLGTALVVISLAALVLIRP